MVLCRSHSLSQRPGRAYLSCLKKEIPLLLRYNLPLERLRIMLNSTKWNIETNQDFNFTEGNTLMAIRNIPGPDMMNL